MDSKKILDRQIEEILDDMVFHGASSAGIMVYKSGNLEYFKSTSYEWHDFYNSSKETNECHLVENSMKLLKNLKKIGQSFSLIWDLQTPNSDEALYLNEKREEYEHCHGISICQTLPNDALIGLTITGRRCDINFAQDVIKNKFHVAQDFNLLKIKTNNLWNS